MDQVLRNEELRIGKIKAGDHSKRKKEKREYVKKKRNEKKDK